MMSGTASPEPAATVRRDWSNATSSNASTDVAVLMMSCQVSTFLMSRIVGIHTMTTGSEMMKNLASLTNREVASAKRSNRV